MSRGAGMCCLLGVFRCCFGRRMIRRQHGLLVLAFFVSPLRFKTWNTCPSREIYLFCSCLLFVRRGRETGTPKWETSVVSRSVGIRVCEFRVLGTAKTNRRDIFGERAAATASRCTMLPRIQFPRGAFRTARSSRSYVAVDPTLHFLYKIENFVHFLSN